MEGVNLGEACGVPPLQAAEAKQFLEAMCSYHHRDRQGELTEIVRVVLVVRIYRRAINRLYRSTVR